MCREIIYVVCSKGRGGKEEWKEYIYVEGEKTGVGKGVLLGVVNVEVKG